MGKAKGELKQEHLSVWTQQMLHKYASGMRARFPNASIDDNLAQLWGHGMVDGALTFAGGLSIPGLLTSMLGVLFSGEYGDFSKSYAPDEYIYETIRYLPAVVGVPWVEEGTTRRQAFALPAALADKKVWG